MKAWGPVKETSSYFDEEFSHAFQAVVEGSQDSEFLERAVRSTGQLLVAVKQGRRVAPAHLLQVEKTPRAKAAILPGGASFDFWSVNVMNVRRNAGAADNAPAGLYKDGRRAQEQLLQSALGTVHVQVGVDVVDVLNCGSEFRSLQLILGSSLIPVIGLWFDTPLLQVANQSIDRDTLLHSFQRK